MATKNWEPFIGAIYGFRTYESGEFRYVGLTTKSVTIRERQHFKAAESGRRKNPFHDWLKKHGRDHAIAVPLAVVTTNLDDLGAAEREWISRLRRDGHRLLNLAEGGRGSKGHVWTEEQRKAAGDRARGRPTGVHRFGPDAPMWGRTHSDEQKAKWSAMRKGTNAGPENPNFGKFGSEHPSYGHTMSAESRARLSELRRGELNPNFGKTASDETRAKMSAVRKGRAMPSSVRNAHTRHHTNKGVFKETCRHCIDDRNNERDNK
ncbi:NUMOD3 motif protein [Agromyces sp. SYSU K20354]|uniref:NUMOD3 domain-containing DNA-binding protein n=1 Tax=Agromyces cavernae TaxID=2898659 RepID=UPI001E649B61|nr:NUMOD3 domain-containing DNA-binding protein [Agromyces cavernae]MCD2443190.1 NUMOD3 motif protein [Agromyces cavernae]